MTAHRARDPITARTITAPSCAILSATRVEATLCMRQSQAALGASSRHSRWKGETLRAGKGCENKGRTSNGEESESAKPNDGERLRQPVVPGPARIRSTSPITTRNGAFRNSTTARSTKS